ncbi:hypothetical protein ACFFJT_11575 [Dyella flava]|uniref:Uncharacterized protein n=1 Tax=Dyella flava TaxID=1920170 RepID=A0ABS2K8D0_9GAMM|nr:hypothetical protein [Dyella flava]MBM7127093.1 hypothetical protein [Dyella flava]GLQ50146.1 hypothetical protein GCM10010872_15950 [Dyella flava]
MKEADEMEVYSLLLGFSDMSEEQQKLFTDGMNKYMYISSARRRQLRLCWERCFPDWNKYPGS